MARRVKAYPILTAFRFSTEDRDLLAAIARRERRTRSAIVRQMIRERAQELRLTQGK